MLGAELSNSLETISDINYANVIKKVEKLFKTWEYRNLSLLGRICVVNSLAVSKLLFLFSSIESPSKKQIQLINNAIYGFVWKGKPDKIKRKVISAPVTTGGANLVNIDAKHKSLKVAWVKRMLSNPDWIQLIEKYTCIPVKIIVNGNLSLKDLHLYSHPNLYVFWKEILSYWVEFSFEHDYQDEELFKQKIFLNSYIKVGNKPIYWASWYEKGLKFIGQLFDVEGNLYDKYFIERKFAISIPHLQWNSLVTAIPTQWKKDIKSYMKDNPKYQVAYMENTEKLLSKEGKWSKIAYDKFINDFCDLPFNTIRKWNEDLETDDISIQWEDICKNQKKIKSTVLRSFNYRFLHRILPCNEFLFKCKIKDSPVCDFCLFEIESYLHLFWECPIVQDLWQKLIEWLNTKYDSELEIDRDLFVLGKFYEDDEHLYIISIIAKQYIFSCKYSETKPTLEGCISKILETQKVEKYIGKKNNMIKKYQNFWKDYTLDVLKI